MGKRLLVIEPSSTIRAILEIYLHVNGNRLIMFAEYGEALQALMLPSHQGLPPDLVLVRLHPSQEESYRVIEYLRQHACYAHTRIIGLISQEDETRRQFQHLVREGQVMTLTSPLRIQNLLELVR